MTTLRLISLPRLSRLSSHSFSPPHLAPLKHAMDSLWWGFVCWLHQGFVVLFSHSFAVVALLSAHEKKKKPRIKPSISFWN
ncbi:hypothetical protein BCR44DRAFT_339207 [Catenaria anguillulae PL171]|uniref:Uncharacterized protein n=1 Tax=Catenaria anguillulae PL171 TaxID=765915 RepID=A0A1Y2HN19_9FUNG|nr:hypothetical protein BCR44DRAFT_339207 [Catenaria anguillulae PL171]